MKKVSCVVGAGLLLAFGGHLGCSALNAVAPECVPDAGSPCTESWCADIAFGCEKTTRLCGEPSGECNQAVCVQGYAKRARGFEHPATQASDFKACESYATTCVELKNCFSKLVPEETCPEVGATDAGPLIESHVGVSLATGAGVVVLPGDTLDCLHCALRPGSCAEQTPDCFQAAPSEAGVTDTCLDYRTCLRMCQESTGSDARRDYLCAAELCDTPQHSAGKASFQTYSRCMTAQCSACFSGPP